MKLAIVDVETTGISPMRDRVIELGVVLVDGNKMVDMWSSLVNPGRSISPVITSITGIEQEDLVDAPRFDVVVEELEERLSGRVMVAHNARFDYGFLRSEFRRVGKDLIVPQLCTVRLSRKLYWRHKGHSLDRIIERFGWEREARHRALGDAQVVWKFLQRAIEDRGKDKVEELIEEVVARPAIPSYVNREIIDELPQCSGVYVFYGAEGEVLYVGKSVNVKERVLSHFYADLRDTKELLMKEKIRDVEAMTTAGELEALLTEAEMVKQMQPVYNRKLKRSRAFWVMKVKTNEGGYKVPQMQQKLSVEVNELDEMVVMFKSKRSGVNRLRKLVKAYGLCLKLTGLESGKGACFGYHLKMCKGACLGQESPQDYNQRMDKAVEELRIASWPYEGPIVVSEYNKETEQAKSHVFDKWCYLGSGENESEMGEVMNQGGEAREFDVDIYQILKSYLRQQKNAVQVMKLSEN